MRTEWVIHIWGKQRDKLELTPQEKFHIDMIKRCKYTTIFDKVLVNISMDDINDESLFSFLKVNLLDLFSGIKEIEIKKCQNDTLLCEYITFRPYVWDRIGEDVRIFYSHFKGYISNAKRVGMDSFTDRIILIIICRLSFSLRKNVAIMGITTGLRDLIRDESDASKRSFPIS